MRSSYRSIWLARGQGRGHPGCPYDRSSPRQQKESVQEQSEQESERWALWRNGSCACGWNMGPWQETGFCPEDYVDC